MDEHATVNNHGVWYRAQAVAIAIFIGNKNTAFTLAQEGKGLIDHQIEIDGRMPEELARTNGLSYSNYNLRALFILARLARQSGVDLWNYTNPKGAGIRRALDWLIPYSLGQKKWGYQQIGGYNKDGDLSSAAASLPGL